MNIKFIISIIGAVISFVSFAPYVRDVLKRKTQPHPYTWLVWFVTQSVAVVGILYGGGRWGALGLSIGTMQIMLVFILSLHFGSKNITKTDTSILVAAFAAIVVWWKLHNPVLAVLMVAVIDILGYFPSFRKSYQEPWSETAGTFVGFVFANLCAIAALSEYSLLTLTYLIAICFANITLVLICLLRRPLVPRPKVPVV